MDSIFGSTISKSLWCQTFLNLVDGFAYYWLSLANTNLAESYVGGLLGPMLLIGFGAAFDFTSTDISILMGARRGEEGIVSGLINASR